MGPTTPDPGRSFGDPAGVLGWPRLDRDLARWAADARVDEAAASRSRQRWLRIQADEEGTLAGTFLDLAERQRPVVLDAVGQRMRGVLVGLGEDFVVLRSDTGALAIVAESAVEVVRSRPGDPMPSGDRQVVLGVDLWSLLTPICADRPDGVVRTTGGVVVRGRLLSAGRDVLRVRGDSEPPAPVWIPRAQVALLTLEGGPG